MAINFNEKKGFICDMDTDIIAGTEGEVDSVLVLSGVSNENAKEQ